MKSLKSKHEYKKALDRMEELLGIVSNETSTENKLYKELDKLSDLVADYEETYYAFEAETLTEMIKLRMYQRGLKQKDLASLLSVSPSRISDILNGKRQLTFDIAKSLHQKLNIDAELILNS